MLLTISTTHTPATELGYLLAKHPDRVQSFATTGGTAQVFYPRADAERCTVALLLEVDPVELARPSKRQHGSTLGQYVNDRPYVASSLLSVALGKVFRSALNGTSKDRAELAATAIPLEVELPAVPCRGGVEIVEQLFAPLGWAVSATTRLLDSQFPEWGDSPYLQLRLTGTLRLAQALNHLYVLLPVLDDAKHYWVDAAEVDKLLRAGAGWLDTHPEQQLIARRYLAGQRSLTLSALEQLQSVDDPAELSEPETPDAAVDRVEVAEQKKPLVWLRREAVLAALTESGAARVLDLGCGPGTLLLALQADPRYTEIVGADVSSAALAIAERRLKFQEMSDRERARISLIQSALTYRDDRLRGYDAAILMEVIEHVDQPRLPALERAVFGHAAPGAVIVTTPNVEYNVRYATLDHGHRHTDHRFEWTRAEFATWADQVAETFGYTVEFRGVGDLDPEVGTPTQLAFFRKAT